MADMQDWSDVEFNLFDDVAGYDPEMYNDRMLHALYDAALFDYDISKQDRKIIMREMRKYVLSKYGIDFDSVFDWEEFRRNYG